MFHKLLFLQELAKKNSLIRNLSPLFSVGFPGGYKFFIVMLVTSFVSTTTASDFSKLFFWVALLYTFSGLPVVSLMVSTRYVIADKDKLILILVSTLFCYAIAYYIELNRYSIFINISVFVSILTLSAYEVLKRNKLNNADFISILFASVFTVFIVITLFSVLFLLNIQNVGLILLSCFMALLIPFLLPKSLRKENLTAPSKLFNIAIAFIKYLLSNATSTSLLFMLPIILVAEVGDVIATDVARVFYFTSLTYLIPHALSAKNIPKMRARGIDKKNVLKFFYIILIFIIIISVTAFYVLQYFYAQWLIYFILFISMQISQLSLPFSNILMVKGAAGTTLKINLISATCLFIASWFIFQNISPGYERAEILLISFLGFQLLKLFLTHFYSQHYFKR